MVVVGGGSSGGDSYSGGGSSGVTTLQYHSRQDSLLLQLLAMYRLQCWWMPPFVLLRRLLLVAVLVLDSSPSVWAWLTLINYCLLALHMQLQPYQRRRDNALETLTLLSLCVQTTLLSVWPPPFMSGALLAALNALIIGPLLPVMLSAAVEARRRRRGRGRRSVREDGEMEERSSGAIGVSPKREDGDSLARAWSGSDTGRV